MKSSRRGFQCSSKTHILNQGKTLDSSPQSVCTSLQLQDALLIQSSLPALRSLGRRISYRWYEKPKCKNGCRCEKNGNDDTSASSACLRAQPFTWPPLSGGDLLSLPLCLSLCLVFAALLMSVVEGNGHGYSCIGLDDSDSTVHTP